MSRNRNSNPVIIEVHLDRGHTFVVIGFDHNEQVLYVRDPALPEAQSRKLTYQEMLKSWHDHRFHDSRSAFFSIRQ